MYVLLPDDPIFLARFFRLDKPFAELDGMYAEEIGAERAAVVRAAYDSWAELAQLLPPALQWIFPISGEGPEGYTLDDPLGRRLQSMYIREDRGGHVATLMACQRMLSEAQLHDSSDPLALALGDLAETYTDWVDDLRRAVGVLNLEVPPRLLDVFRSAAPVGPNVMVSLNADQADDYRTLCSRIVYALSAGDELGYTTHRMLYAS
ncbi:hypothetical protein AB0D90_31110 [Streptomyces althioticus]|uniref:hypothetical protein n=1 Tax=Streptomyces althioticus TaxID=83380 RepID=UPI0033F44524